MPFQYQDLSQFRVAPGFRGRSGLVVLTWQIVQSTLFAWSPQPLYGWRRWLLRCFGATIGRKVLIRPTARVTFPWKVSIGDFSWIGDRTELYSLGPIVIGSSAVVSQNSYICAASHDLALLDFPLTESQVTIGDQAWVAADCFVSPGVSIGRGAIVAARSTVLNDVPAGMIVAGAPATVRKPRVPPDSFAQVTSASKRHLRGH